MDDDELDMLLGNPDEFGPYDNVMLNMPDAPAVVQPTRRGAVAEPLEYVDPRVSVALLHGIPAPPPDDEFVDYDTSCDELEEYDPYTSAEEWSTPNPNPNPRRPPNPPPNGDDEIIDDAFSSSSSSITRAECASQGIDRLLADGRPGNRGIGGGRGAGGGAGGGSGAPSGSIRDLHNAPRTQCFGCLWTSRNQVKVDKNLSPDKINQMNKIWSDLFGRSSNWTAAKLVHLFFKHEIYSQLAARRNAAIVRGDIEHAPPMVAMWRTKEILIHYTRHQLDPRVHFKTTIERFRHISEMLYMTSCSKTAGGSGVAPVEKNIALMLRVEAQLMRMYSQSMTGLNFHNDEIEIDFRTMGALMGPYRRFAIEPA